MWVYPKLDAMLSDHYLKVFAGYWPEQNSVVVAHEGTDPTKL